MALNGGQVLRWRENWSLQKCGSKEACSTMNGTFVYVIDHPIQGPRASQSNKLLNGVFYGYKSCRLWECVG